MTLYVFDNDRRGVPTCYGSCASMWPPYLAQGAGARGYSVVRRNDGSRQWAYRGRPLYYWAGDRKPGDTGGNGIGGIWHDIRLGG